MTRKSIFKVLLLILSLIFIFIFCRSKILFSNSKVLLLKSTSRVSCENSYIELTGFSLENDILKIDLLSPLGDSSDWSETSLSINSQEYPLNTNVFTEVTGQDSLNYITYIGEINIDDLSNDHNSIYLITPYEKIEINYIEKHKLYY